MQFFLNWETITLILFLYLNSGTQTLSLSFACWKSSNINHLHLKLFLSLYMSVSIIFPSLQILFVARDVIFNSKDDFKYLFLDQEPWSRLINKSSKPGSLLSVRGEKRLKLLLSLFYLFNYSFNNVWWKTHNWDLNCSSRTIFQSGAWPWSLPAPLF